MTAPMTAPEATAPPVRRRPPNRGKKGGRIRKIDVRVDDTEYLVIDNYARNAGLSRGSFLRASALGSPGPRARRSPPINAEVLAHAVAQLNKAGSNLNQIAHVLNSAQAVGAKESLEALAETRAAVARILEIVGRKNRA